MVLFMHFIISGSVITLYTDGISEYKINKCATEADVNT